MKHLKHDIRQAFRMMRDKPGFALVVLISLALGIGGTTAIFTLINNLMLRPLPFREAEELCRLRDRQARPGKEPRMVGMSARNYLSIKEEKDIFADVGAAEYTSFNLIGGDQPERIEGSYMTANVFPMLGVQPLMGRIFTPAEDQPGNRARVVVLGYDVWHVHFAADPQILNKQIRLNDESYTVIGVMPQRFRLPYESGLWVPMGLEPTSLARPQHYLFTFARLNHGLSREEGEKKLELVASRLAQSYPDTNAGWDFNVMSMREEMTDDIQAKLLFALLTASAFLLLIACANVANMMLARSLEQGREIAIRAALGASRWRLLQQLFTQGLVLALLSGAMGILLAHWFARALILISPMADMDPYITDLSLDSRVLLFTIGVSLVVGCIFSLAPAFKASRPDLQTFLKEESRSTSTVGGRRLLGTVVVLEVAVAVVLLISAALTIRSLQHLLSLETGYPTHNLLTMHMALPDSKFQDTARKVHFLDLALQRIRAVPGVKAADVTTTFTLDGSRVASQMTVEEHPPVNPDDVQMANHRLVSPTYLKTVGIPLRQGRGILPEDRADSPPVVVISKNLADTYWPGENPLGKRVKRNGISSDYPWMTVVGVVNDVKEGGDLDVKETWYIPYTQGIFPTANVTLVARTAGDPEAMVDAIRKAIAEVDREQPIYNISTADEMILEGYQEQRFSMFLFSMFAVLGLTLALVGIYGILSYSVVQRTREMGLRMAMGAEPRHILSGVIREGLLLTSIGVVLGLAGAWVLTRQLAAFLSEISTKDPVTYGGIALGALLVSILASYIPARRATKVDPVTSLR